jgi:hypothetical protein
MVLNCLEMEDSSFSLVSYILTDCAYSSCLVNFGSPVDYSLFFVGCIANMLTILLCCWEDTQHGRC